MESRKLTVVDRREIDLIRNEIDFQFSGDVGDDSMQESGRMLGAQAIISGNFTDMGGFIRIMIRVLNVQNASVEVQYRANIVSDTVTTALLAGGRTNVAATAPRQASPPAGTQATTSTASSQPTTPAAPTRHTVTFNANGASGTAPSSQTVQSGESITIPDKGTMASSRGNFSGWNTRADGTGTSYVVGDILVVNANIQLFARWIEQVYRIGDTGPAGGLIFYDKGNSSGGWRYLEAAPASAEFTAPWYPPGRSGGYSGNDDKDVGKGLVNTKAIVGYFTAQFSGGFGSAAWECNVLVVNGFDDWFIPSSGELFLMYGNLHRRGLGNFTSTLYWSSSARTNGRLTEISLLNFQDGSPNSHWMNNGNPSYRVRPMRQF